MVPGEAEQPVLASGPECLLDAHASEPAAADRDLGSTLHAACLKLSAEQMAEVGQACETGSEEREAAIGAAVGDVTPRSAKTSASQVIRLHEISLEITSPWKTLLGAFPAGLSGLCKSRSNPANAWILRMLHLAICCLLLWQ